MLKHIYINPLEKCNLKCKICYTRKTAPILSNESILRFIDNYRKVHALESVTFCGGEVFALTSFPTLLNEVTKRGVFSQVITNGTLDQLDLIDQPNAVSLIVSLDGLPDYHDSNRGEGMFAKSLSFMKKAKALGFHLHVFSIVTRQNVSKIDEFEAHLADELGEPVEITFHPRKPPAYLLHHPVSNIVGEVSGFDFLEPKEFIELLRTRKTFPPKDLGCYQVAVMSDGRVFGCCEGITPLGMMDNEISFLTEQLEDRLEKWSKTSKLANCLGCSQPEFVCGIKEYLAYVT